MFADLVEDVRWNGGLCAAYSIQNFIEKRIWLREAGELFGVCEFWWQGLWRSLSKSESVGF
jgi:hypothetical protein